MNTSVLVIIITTLVVREGLVDVIIAKSFKTIS